MSTKEERRGLAPRSVVVSVTGGHVTGRGGRPIEAGAVIGPGEPLRATSGAPPGATWNGIRRLWLVEVAGEMVPLDPQPSPPVATVPPAIRVDC